MNFFKYTQPKDESDIKCSSDCMIRSIANATGESYTRVHQIMYKNGWRASRRNEKTSWESQVLKTLEELGFGATKISFPAKKGEPRMDGFKMAKSFSNGSYILRMARHLSCLKDGYVLDTVNLMYKCVYFAWEIHKK